MRLRMLRAASVVAALVALLGTTGCTNRNDPGCGGGGDCVAVVPVPTSDRAHLRETAEVGHPVISTLATSSSRAGACFRLVRAGAAPVYLAFPPRTSATPMGPRKGQRGGYTLIGLGVGGLGTGQRVAVAPDAVRRHVALPGCPAGTVWYTSRIARVSTLPGAEAAPCDQAATAPFDCRQYASARGFDPARGVPWLRTDPVPLRIRVVGGLRTAEIAGPAGTISVPITLRALGGWSRGSASVLQTACSPSSATRCQEDGWLRAFLRGRISWGYDFEHPTVLTLHAEGRRALDFRIRP